MGAFEYQQTVPLPVAECQTFTANLVSNSITVSAADMDNGNEDDACGNTKIATQRINVIDTQKPNFTATPANVTVLGNSYAEEEGAENRKDPADAAQNLKFKSLNLQPNPTTDRVWLDLSDFSGAEVTVSIFSDLGRLIWERSIPVVEAQKLPVSLREAGAAAGIYTISVRSASGVVAKRVVLVE